jgi:hypothetical protein
MGDSNASSVRRSGRLPVTRGIVATTIALALLTGLVIGALGRLSVLAPEVVPASETRAEQLGRDYYEAVDHLLATGDSQELRQLLSDDFQSHAPATGMTGDAESLIADFQSLRNVYPGIRQEITELAGSDSLIIASITIPWTSHGQFAGLSIAWDQPQQQQEILRVRDGLIVERWSDANPPLQLMTIANIGETSMSGVPEMTLWHVDPHARDTVRERSEVVLIMTSGTLIVEPEEPTDDRSERYRMTPASPNGIETSSLTSAEEVREGDVLIVPGGAELLLRNSSVEPAAMLSIAAGQTPEDVPYATLGAEGITRELLARGFSLDAAGSGYAVHIGHASLDSGSTFTHPGIDDGGEFAFGTNGWLTAEAVDGLVWTFDSAANVTANGDARLTPGEGVAIHGASEVRFEETGSRPAAFWIVTFVPIVELDRH